MFSIPQDVLKQLLSTKNTTPERLSNQEIEIAARIMHCTLCGELWVRRKKSVPERCPKCHHRGWDRPLLTAMLTAQQPTTQKNKKQEKADNK